MKPGEVEKLFRSRDTLCQGCCPRTKTRYAAEVRRWIQYCDERGLDTWQRCDADHAIDWINRWKKEGKAARSIHTFAMFPLRCVEHLKQVEPASVHSAFAVPRALVPRILPAYHGKVLSQDIVRKILRMSCHDVAHTRALNATSITGFLVLFCLRTGMNVDSVLNLPRGCAVPTDDGSGHWIYWEKERSQGGMLEFHEPAVWGAVEVIHRLEQMHDRPLLFSVEGIAAPLTRVGDRIGAWCEFHGLPRFRLSEIRPAMASILYEKNGGDVEDVRNYLHHANLDTTMGYVAENISRPINERLLNDAQEAMLDCWGVPKEL